LQENAQSETVSGEFLLCFHQKAWTSEHEMRFFVSSSRIFFNNATVMQVFEIDREQFDQEPVMPLFTLFSTRLS
jgi:hypothetical protein